MSMSKRIAALAQKRRDADKRPPDAGGYAMGGETPARNVDNMIRKHGNRIYDAPSDRHNT